MLGKTRMHELAEGVTSINVFGGPVLNPYNNAMHVGGSSGGTTAVVAMRMAPAGFCSDTGGATSLTPKPCIVNPRTPDWCTGHRSCLHQAPVAVPALFGALQTHAKHAK